MSHTRPVNQPRRAHKNIKWLICNAAMTALLVKFALLSAPAAFAAPFQEGLNAFHRGDYRSALAHWQPLAKTGHPKAAYLMGLLYAEGMGVSPDDSAAIDWFRQASEQGLADAQFSLGAMLEHGRGGPADPAQAAHWYQLAAEQGHALAQYSLGLMYADGRGVESSPATATGWFQRAADQDLASAQLALAIAYDTGSGLPQNASQALPWYYKAANHGDAQAQYLLGDRYRRGHGLNRDLTEAVRWFRLAAEQGHAGAQNELGELLAEGSGVAQSWQRAAFWFAAASRQHHGLARKNLTAARSHLQQRQWHGEGTPVYSMNTEKSDIVATPGQGQRLYLLSETNSDWVEIYLPGSDLTGFAPTDSVRLISKKTTEPSENKDFFIIPTPPRNPRLGATSRSSAGNSRSDSNTDEQRASRPIGPDRFK